MCTEWSWSFGVRRRKAKMIVIDPVCNMTVEDDEAATTVEFSPSAAGGERSGGADRASHGERLAEIRLDLRIRCVGLYVEGVKRLAEEAAHAGCQDDVEDLIVGEAEVS